VSFPLRFPLLRALKEFLMGASIKGHVSIDALRDHLCASPVRNYYLRARYQ
jgi:hypothetical protein